MSTERVTLRTELADAPSVAYVLEEDEFTGRTIVQFRAPFDDVRVVSGEKLDEARSARFIAAVKFWRSVVRPSPGE